MARHQFGLRRLIFGAHLAGIAALPFAFDPGDILDEDRLGAERHNLFAGRRTYVGRADLCTKPPSGRDRLQPRDPDPHDEQFGRTDRPRRGHHHRISAAISRRCVDHRLVAGQIGLRGQDVHRLRPRDAWQPLHRQRVEPGGAIRSDIVGAPRRIERAKQQRALLRPAQRRRVGPGDSQDDIGVGKHRGAVADRGASRFEIGIADRGLLARAPLDRDARAERGIFLDGLGDRRDARFDAAFLEDCDLHAPIAINWR